MKKILITGANGYIGSRLCQYLSNKNYKVTALSHSVNSNLQVNNLIENITGDVRDIDLITELAEREFDVLIHLVSLDHSKSNGNPVFVSSVNLVPTWSLLDVFSKKGLRQFIYFSTTQVYGIPEGVCAEDINIMSTNPYGLTHYLSEKVCEYYNRNSSIDCTVFRLSNSYGSPVVPNNNCWALVINNLCQSAFIHNHIKLVSDGTPLRDFIHGNDVCRAVQHIIDTDDKRTRKDTYNLSSGKTLTIMELAIAVKEIYNKRYWKNISIETTPANSIKATIPFQERYIITNEKLKLTGFNPSVDLEAGINELFDYLEYNYDKLS